MSAEKPRVGVGVYIRRDGKVLFGKRIGGYADGEWCAPGGKVDMNEHPDACVIRETYEETGLVIDEVRFITFTNDVHDNTQDHYVTLHYVADWKGGEPVITEPDKFETWGWFAWEELPNPLLLSNRNFRKNGYNPLVI